MYSAISRLFSWLGDLISRAASAIVDAIARIIGHGARAMMYLSFMVGAGFFTVIQVLIRYTPVGTGINEAFHALDVLAGPNKFVLGWIFNHVLAFDHALFLITSVVGLSIGCWSVYFAIRLVNRFLPL